MKRQTFILIFILSLIAGKIAGQCTMSITGGTSPVCYNSSPGTLTASGDGGTYSYQWYSTFGIIDGAISPTFDPGNITASTGYYCAITNVTCGTINTSTISITVDPASIGGSISGSSAVCTGVNSTILNLTGYTGNINKWQYSTDNWVTPIDIVNNTNTLTATNLSLTTKYRAVVKSGTCSSVNSGEATVTVDPVPVGGSISGSVSVCSGTNSTILTLSGYTGSVDKWQYSTDNWATPVAIVNNTDTYTATNLSVTTKYRAVIISGACSSVNSADATVTVDPVPDGGSISGSVSVCSGTNSSVLTLSGYIGSISKWQYSTDNWATPVDIINNTNTNTATNLSVTTRYRAVIQSGACTSINSGDATVTVDPVPVGGSISGSISVCSGVNSTVLTLSGYTGSIDKWQYSTDNWSTPVDIVNNTNTYTATNLSVTTKYRVVIQSGICSSVNSGVATLTVDPVPVGGSISGSASVCSGVNSTVLNLSGYTGSIEKWQYSIDNWVTPIDIANTSSTFTATNLTLTTRYRAAVKSGACSSIYSVDVAITVNPLPVPSISGNSPACITSTGNVYTTESGMSNYAWVVSAGGSISSGGGSGDNSVTVTWNSTGAQTVSVNYKNGSNCTGASPIVYNVTVNPKPLPSNVQITGVLKQFATISASYNYVPGPCFPEDLSLTEISWYRANNSGGSSSSFITTKSGLDKTYVLAAADVGKFIQVRVKLSDGTTLMSSVSSTGWVGAVASNDVPVASNVSLTGTIEVNGTLTGTYDYNDTENDLEGASIIEWYRADNNSGSNSHKITGATTLTYVLSNTEKDKYIRLKVTPLALTGSTPGSAAYSSPWIGPVTDKAPVASLVTITGTPGVRNVLTGHYQYSDAEGDLEGVSTYQWYTGTNSSGAGSAPIVGATSISYLLTNNELGKYIGFSVIPAAQDGTTPGLIATTATWVGQVTNDAPVATAVSISGTLNVNSAITGHYLYSDSEGDLESGTTYRWYSAPALAGPYSVIPGETAIAHTITLTEQGKYFKFYVTPRAGSGTINGIEVSSAGYGPANSKPYADNVTITGNAFIGSTLTGGFSPHDDDLDGIGTCTYRWLRNLTTPITGATSINYLVTSSDEGSKLSFEVTPVSSTGYPNIGNPVTSAETSNITDTSTLKPVASEVCIEGIRAAGDTLRGKYRYTFYKSEGASTYRWILDGVTICTAKQYILKEADISGEKDITFEVTPVSSNYIPKTGDPVTSNPLARITIPQDEYSIAVSEVTLTSNESGGVYSGPGVTDGKFSPRAVGITGSPYTVQYLLNIVNYTTTCSQKTTKKIKVVTSTTNFNGINDVYCHDGGEDVISISGLPPDAITIGFSLTNPYGIVSSAGTSITIDPGRMRPGNNVDVLSFKYWSLGSINEIKQPLIIDSVGTDMRFINLDTAYCKEDPKQSISVVGVYPSGGNAIWTGTLLSELKTTSAVLDPSAGLANHKYSISYQYKSINNCFSKIITKDVTINPLPDPDFVLDSTYNIDGGAKTLIPVQPGGIFTGSGISGNRLFPDIAGLGEHTISYSITDANNCSSSLPLKTTIWKAQGSFIDLPSLICYRDTTFNPKVTGLPAGVTVTNFVNTKKSIIHLPGATNAAYNIPAAGAGLDTLVFSYKWSGVDYNISTIINIDSLGQVSIQNLSPGDVICNNIAPFELFTSLKGGVFTGPVTGGYFDPTKALGPASVFYKYTNQKTGCSTSVNIPVSVISAPVVSFIPADNCIDNESDSTRFVNTTTFSGLVNDWFWEFADAGGSKTSTKKEPAYLYKTGGLHQVTLTAKTTNNCTVTKMISIDLGVKPIADFYWKNECYHTGESLELVDTTFSTSNITSRTWNFFDGGALLTDINPTYPKTTTGYQKVQLIVNTNYLNCSDTVTRNIFIRPSVSLSADNYFQNFETGNGGWVKNEDSGNSWSFGKPDRTIINTASSGDNAWYTSYALTNQKSESSSIVSPCFDFTTSERPMISLKLWRRFDLNRDGAALQYKIKDEKTWHYIGTLNDGINWFNSAVIKGKPGGEPLGWTIKDNDWIESRHTLDELKNKKDVKFRIAYGSDGTSVDNDGIAFDDIWIGERTRKVLLEHFSNTSSLQSKIANVMVNDIAAGKNKDVINIQYHTNFPGADPFYNLNPGDASARILFYGLTKAPYSFIDGGTRKNYANIFDYIIADIDSNDVTRRTLVNPSFDINLNSTVFGGVLSVNSQIKALEDVNSENLTLYFVVTEKKHTGTTGANGETVFYNIFKKFLPDAGGINLKKTWVKGEIIPISDMTWIIEKTLNSADIEVIAFIQNSSTKELYQASSQIKLNIAVGIENPLKKPGSGFALYPNPTVNVFTIAFKDPLIHDADIRIYDLQGIVIATYKAGSGKSEFTVNNLVLKGGIYMVRVSSGGIDFGFKKLIISGD